MAERNMLAEGFISNTLAPDGSISGTQIATIPEMNALVDGDLSTTALTVSGAFFISLDADLGARWKLNRIELYSEEPNSLNFDMSVSEDDEDYFPITMTGSAGYWFGTVSGTTVSGAPRYIRLRHAASTARDITEWTAINDDTLVDFGEDGTQTEVEIEDAPIGKPSDSITELKLKNQFTKTAQGFVFIGETGDKGDDNFELSLSPNGPWFGRLTQSASQPDNLPWETVDQSAKSFSFRPRVPNLNAHVPTGPWAGINEQNYRTGLVVITGTAYSKSFANGRTEGWDATDFTSGSIDGGVWRGNNSTATNPTFRLRQGFGESNGKSPDSVEAISNNFRPFRAEHYDRARVVLTNPSHPVSDWVEGPRFYWKTLEQTGFDITSKLRSQISTTSGIVGNGSGQTVEFDLNIPTWSGIITALAVGPWTTATGIGLTGSISSVEVYKDGIDNQDRVILEEELPVSGTWIGYNSGSITSANQWRIVVNTENVVKDKCIITSVSCPTNMSNTRNVAGWFLCRFRDGFEYQDRATEINVGSADPFEVIFTTLLDEEHDINQVLITKKPVYWYAEPGDMVGFAYSSYAGPLFTGPLFRFDTNLTTTTGGSLASQSFMDIDDGATDLQTDMNANTNWFTTGARPNVQFRSVPLSPYQGTGIYTTPVFDGGGDPALLQFEYESIEENGSSIDVDGNATLNTVEARADIRPPNTKPALGRRMQQFMLGAHISDRPSRFDPRYTSNYVIGLMNPEVEARENVNNAAGDTQIENMGNNAFYHEVNQELWVLNINISGTVNSDMRPIWDVYDIDEDPPNYLRTQHMTGSIPYTFDNDQASNTDRVFECVGWQADYDREQIFVIMREDSFAIGSARYNGLIMTLDGEYVDVFWRNDQLVQDIQDRGVESNATTADRRLQQMRTVVYRAPYFYALTTSNTGADSDDGIDIDLYRLGNNPLQPDNPNDVEFRASIDLGTVPGLTSITPASPVDTMAYCSSNDLFYFTKDDGDDIFTFSAAITGATPNESFVISAGPISQDSTNFFAEDALIQDFSATVAYTTVTPWRGSGQEQELKRFMDLTYCKDRDSFIHMLSYRCNRTKDVARDGQNVDLDHFWHFHNHTVMMEYGADTEGNIVETPAHPNLLDPFWGVVSGTVPYEQLSENSILFPTGRYAQLRYTLRASDDKLTTPYLLSSRVNQGISVGDVSPSGTKSIYLRTNIPDTETVGDQTGKLKVYWQLKGD